MRTYSKGCLNADVSEKFALDFSRTLIDQGIISEDTYQIALIEQKKSGHSLEQIYLDLGFMSEVVLRDLLVEAHTFKSYDSTTLQVDSSLQSHWPLSHAQKYRLLPARLEGQRLNVVMVDGFNLAGLDALKIQIPHTTTIIKHIALEHEFETLLRQTYRQTSTFSVVRDILQKEASLLEVDAASPTFSTTFLEALLVHAIEERASDLHFEIESNFVRTRLRIDGLLRPLVTFHRRFWASIVGRIKVIAELNMADTRHPQNGRCSLSLQNRTVDLRVSTHPTLHGEDIVIRILDQKSTFTSLEGLGFLPDQLSLLKNLSTYPEGIILLTGPTGSGKTTTLYGLLNHLQSSVKKVMTLEQPIEYTFSQIRQTAIHEGHGLTFAEGVRSILRQDPDVLMIGEIRDETTAQMALRASMTGHLVFSTLHTKDVLGALLRLKDLGIGVDLLGNNLLAIVAQRLVRKTCCHCFGRKKRQSTVEKLHCLPCGQTGFDGRTVIAEILPMNGAFEEIILSGKISRSRIADCLGSSHKTMHDHADLLIQEGITTQEEVCRVIPYSRPAVP